MNSAKNKNIRYLVLIILAICLGLVLTIQLFNLQILHGEEYKEASQRRLFREAEVQAPRGEIFDRNGVLLVTNREAFNVELLKIAVDPEKLDKVILSLIKILEKDGDAYIDNFPMNVDPIQIDPLSFSGHDDPKLITFMRRFKVKNFNISDKELFNDIRKFYNIDDSYSVDDARKIIGIRYEMSEQAISQFDPVTIAMDVSKETVAQLEEQHLELPGVSVVVEPVRDYPRGSLSAHILGYIGKINDNQLKKLKPLGYNSNDIIGKDGVERTMEELLKGKNGKKQVQMDTVGRLTGEVGTEAPKPGDSIYLTIDAKLQAVAEKALADTIYRISHGGYADKFTDSKAGSVVAIDVKSGQILAMANYPTYDPSMFVKGISSDDWKTLMGDDQKPMFDRAVSGLYSPGSTFKMVTGMAALGEGKVTPEETVLDQGEYTRYKYRGKAPACWLWNSEHRTHGYVNLSEALKVSCNYYFFEMGYRAGISNIEKYARMFGLGNKTGIELPGERSGIVAGPDYRKTVNEKWYDGDTLSAAIGQSDNSFTPIQMAEYISTLVNGGTKYRPTLINKVTQWDGKVVGQKDIDKILIPKIGDIYNQPVQKINFNKSYINAIFEGMKSVTGDAGGTAYATFAGFPVAVAGKTGTVQVSGRYKDGVKKSDNAWFVGFAPYDNPQIAVIVLIEHGGHGGYTAPVAKEIFAQYFGLNQPVQDTTQKADANAMPKKNNNQLDQQNSTVRTDTLDQIDQTNQTNQTNQTD